MLAGALQQSADGLATWQAWQRPSSGRRVARVCSSVAGRGETALRELAHGWRTPLSPVPLQLHSFAFALVLDGSRPWLCVPAAFTLGVCSSSHTRASWWWVAVDSSR